VVPQYPVGGKRAVLDNGVWLGALKRENVQLVTEKITKITPKGVVTADGKEHEADVLIYGTGFQASNFLSYLKVKGRGGRDLHETWGGDAKAYLGMTVPGFPNFFMMYGPGTNLASGGSLIFHSECEIRYIVQCLQALDGHTAMEPRQDRYDEWYDRCQRELKGLVWSSPHIEHSFYKNAEGDVHGLSPWRLVDFWAWTRTPDLDDFVIT
jgi:4-hydroxyacetophenone monooxygenase